MPDANNPVVLVHGYSDEGKSFQPWAGLLAGHGYKAAFDIVTYRSLVNHLTIKDIAEGFDRALTDKIGSSACFDAIVHSTGMLVMRSWLTAKPERRARLKRLIGLAPATFGSPLAASGRSLMGSLVKGTKDLGPDFLAAGDQVLDGLELASRFTWDLSHKDLFGGMDYYGKDPNTPFVFIFIGNEPYGGLRLAINKPGTDGTVRWAGCGLATRKIVIDFTASAAQQPIDLPNWTHEDIPPLFVNKRNHGTILSDPPDALVAAVVQILSKVTNVKSFTDMRDQLTAQPEFAASRPAEQWQEFVVHAVDERGDSIPDYNIELFTSAGTLDQFEMHPDVYSTDSSFRCFHVNLTQLGPDTLNDLKMRLTVTSGSRYVGYRGYRGSTVILGTEPREGIWQGELDMTSLLTGNVPGVKNAVKFFYPFTTTLVELRLDRQPLPLTGKNEVCWFCADQ